MNKFGLIFIFIFAVLFWVFWLPGPRVATDYYLSSTEIIKDYAFPWGWRENAADGLGEYTVGTLWSHPIHILARILLGFNISVIWITKISLALFLSIGFFSITRLLSYLQVGKMAKYVGALFYLLNTYFLLLIDGGQLSLAFVYCLVPLCIYFYLKTIDQNSFKNRLNFISSLLIVSFLDIRFVFLVFLIFFVHIIFSLVKPARNTKVQLFNNLFITGLLSTVTLIAAHFYWILPAFFLHNLQLPQTYERSSQVDFLSWSSLAHSLFMQQPHWYKNIFGNISNIKFEFSLIPILVFSTLILKRRNKVIGFWLIIAVLGIFFSKGSREPFGGIYTWAFSHIPGFSLFRDPVKFYLLSALAYSILISISVREMLSFHNGNKNISQLIKCIPSFILVYFILLVWPVYFNQMTGMFSEPRFEQEFLEQSEILSHDTSFSRIVWVPTQVPLGYTSINHPSIGALKLSQKRPFEIGIKGTYETFNFLRDAPFMGEIFDVAGIGYINYPYLDVKRDEMDFDKKKYFYTFLNQLSKLSWLEKVPESKIPLLKTTQHQDKFFMTPNIWWVIGSDKIYNEATKSANLKLARNALIFSEEYPGLGASINNLPNVKIVLQDKTNIDLAASFIIKESLIFPAQQLKFDPDPNSGWWKKEAADLINWRDFLLLKYGIDNQDFDLGGGWAVSEGNKELKINISENQNSLLRKGNILLARVMESSKSGSLNFYQDSQLIGGINTKKEGNNIRWFEVGQLPKTGGQLKILSHGNINVVNAIAALSKKDWEMFKNKATGLQGRIMDFNEINADSYITPKISYRRMNPTEYLVNISGLTKSSLLIFSQNYDRLWKMNNQQPIPVYSLLNGFTVDKDGQYIVEFESQKYINLGLIVSISTIGILILLVIKYSKHR